jgi:tetratricopeptide (TPR) repeat protein
MRDKVHAAAIVNGLVGRALDAMDRAEGNMRARRAGRHAAILLRCDVLREARRAIASDLRLSLRQFERERRNALDRFETEILKLQRTGVVERISSSLAEIEFERAIRLADCGKRTSALSLLLNVAAQSGSDLERSKAFLRAVVVEIQEWEKAGASAYLTEAERIFMEGHLTPGEREEANLLLDAARLRVAALFQGPLEESRLEELKRLETPSCAAVDMLLARTEFALARGGGVEASKYVAAARALAACLARDELDPVLEIDLLFLEAQLAFWVNNDRERTQSGVLRAARFSDSQGLNGRKLILEWMATLHRWENGTEPAARERVRTTIDRLDDRGPLPKSFRYGMLFASADAEMAFGSPLRATAAANRALNLAIGDCDRLHMQSVICKSLSRAGSYRMARRKASEILDTPHNPMSGRAILNARLALADAAIAMGDRREAYDNLLDAIGLSQKYGSALMVMNSFKKLARLTGEPFAQRRVVEISQYLREAR